MKPTVACPPFSAADFLADCREHEIGLRVDGSQLKVKFGLYRPSLDLIEWIRANKPAIIAAIQEEGRRPAPAPQQAQVPETAPESEPEAVVEPPRVALESEQPQTVLVVGATSWAASKAGPIRDRLMRLPIETRILVIGDVEARSKKGLPTGAAAIVWAACPVLGLEAEVEQDVDAALSRANLLVAFHPAIDRSRATAAVVEQARALGLTVEVVSGLEIPTARVLRREKETAR